MQQRVPLRLTTMAAVIALQAEVTGGGVPLNELNCATCESRKLPVNRPSECNHNMLVFPACSCYPFCFVPISFWQKLWRKGSTTLGLQGVHICGELLDVFGRIGGFNFYWAFVTGRLAGLAAATAG